MSDPRASNCQGFATDGAGMVSGVLLIYKPIPSAKYELLKAELIDEASAAGNVVAKFSVLDKNGIETAERVWLAWPFPGLQDGKALPGNSNNEHMVSGLPYNPPDVGPGGMYVGDAQGNPISDIIGGLGLPYKRHVCYRLTWKERSGTVVTPPPPDPDPDPDPTPVTADMTGVIAKLNELITVVKQGFRL